ncbi:MAG TPA: PhoU domain-containing protein [Terriglobales bacterium]|nr:PhoU domain-containing protein [Terriglobales bacterium]
MARKRSEELESTRKLTGLVLQGCLVAKDASYNLRDFIQNSSNMAFLAVRDCEKELDRMERQVDEEISAAITQVNETQARELLACLKFIIDLERIGDLTWSVAQRLQKLGTRLQQDDAQDFQAMAEILENMLGSVHEGFVRRDLDSANWVLESDVQIDHACRAVFHRHLASGDRRKREYSTNLLLMAQAFERAGDHAKNLGEELLHLVEGRSVRHEPKRLRAARKAIKPPSPSRTSKSRSALRHSTQPSVE